MFFSIALLIVVVVISLRAAPKESQEDARGEHDKEDKAYARICGLEGPQVDVLGHREDELPGKP